jgi:hypothetical protein
MRSLTFGIVANRLLLSDVVLIGQLRINPPIGVEILECKPT